MKSGSLAQREKIRKSPERKKLNDALSG